ncbi:MAG: hypothetical protein V1874_17110 [Spirochaetota bacterium]
MKKYILMLLIQLMYSCSNASNTEDAKILTPNVPQNCYIGECVKDQFITKPFIKEKYYFAIITKTIEIMNEPKDNAKGLLTLIPGRIVIVISNNYKGDSKWAFVQTEHSNQGWVRNDCVAYKSMFKPEQSWTGKKLEYGYGDINYYITFFSNGQYTGKWVSTYPADKGKSGKASGTVFRYESILYLKYSDPMRPDLFIELCDPKKDEGCSLKIE